MASTASRLRSDLSFLIQELETLIQGLPVETQERFPGIISLTPDYYWGELTSEQINTQLAIKREYEEWFEVFRSVFINATNELDRRVHKADKQLRKWIELSKNYAIRPNINNGQELRNDTVDFFDLLEIIEASGPMEPVLIPDTNAMISTPDPTQYRGITGDDHFTFLLLPTVLAELDGLKNSHRNPALREKVNKAITRIKGWRHQGHLLNGVTVDKTITVKAVAIEPDMSNTLAWLDKENRDDRIIASVLNAQSSYPTAQVVLVTGDINLLNKADLARIETTDAGHLN